MSITTVAFASTAGGGTYWREPGIIPSDNSKWDKLFIRRFLQIKYYPILVTNYFFSGTGKVYAANLRYQFHNEKDRIFYPV
jgi:hypothetical protein